MKRFRFDVGGLLAASLALVGLTNACHASHHNRFGEGGAPPTMAAGGAPSSSDDGAGAGGWASYHFPGLDAGAPDAADETILDPCGSACGPVELCDPAHLGFDDNCNGQVDEGCACSPGAVHWCFKGDPSYRNAPGCFDGTETCSELGTWGPCNGGVQGVPPDNCFLNDTSACHAITAVPFATTDLKTGTGNFSANAVAGTETYAVTCPAGVSPCPGVMPPESFLALQSGEYLVTYTKSVAGDPSPISCNFALFVGAPGLRIELSSWEHALMLLSGLSGPDLDLHVHQPMNSQPWSVGGAPQDCGWGNCPYIGVVLKPTNAPHWWPDTNAVPDPVNWDLNPVADDNTCYSDPRGVGASWAQLGMGCHNPRLDVDDITCDPAETDPSGQFFCTPENTNIDYPPLNEWIRIGVHYYFNHGVTFDVHPEIKVFCDGALAADLGPNGYYTAAADAGPDAGAQVVTFTPGRGRARSGQRQRLLDRGRRRLYAGCLRSTHLRRPADLRGRHGAHAVRHDRHARPDALRAAMASASERGRRRYRRGRWGAVMRVVIAIARGVARVVLGALYVDARLALAAEREHAKRLGRAHAREVTELRASLAEAERRLSFWRECSVAREPFARAEPARRLLERKLGPDGKAAVRTRLAALVPEDAA